MLSLALCSATTNVRDGGDTVDLSALLGGIDPAGAGQYVRLEGNMLKVDTDGAAADQDFRDVATFATTIDQVTVTIDTGLDLLIDRV